MSRSSGSPTRKSKRMTAFASIAAAVIAIPLLAACATAAAPAGSGSGDPVEGGILRVGSPTPNAIPEPVTMYDPGSINVVQQVAEYLIWSENDGTLTPQLADSWEPNEDGSVWTIDLRDDVLFNDGTPMTSADVVASIERLIAPDSVSAAASAFATILTAGSVSASDDDTVVFTLDRPFADFPYLLSSANYNALILKEDYDGDFMASPIGTGPFLLDDYVAETSATFVPYEDYYGADEVYLDQVDMTFFTDGTAQTSALLSGSIDVAAIITFAQNQALYSSDQVEVETTSISGGTFLAMRTDTAPWDDKLVRQALAMSLDREALLQALAGGQGEVANDHMFSPLYAQKVDVPQRELDIEGAADLLAEAGYPDGLEATLSAPQSASAYAQLIQQMAAEAGFDLTLDIQDNATFYDTGWLDVPLGLTGWAARPTASQFLSLAFTSDAVWNTAHWSNAEFDGLVEELQATVDETARTEIAQEIATLMNDEVPQIITMWPEAGIAFSPKVQGIPVNASSYAELSHGWLEG